MPECIPTSQVQAPGCLISMGKLRSPVKCTSGPSSQGKQERFAHQLSSPFGQGQPQGRASTPLYFLVMLLNVKEVLFKDVPHQTVREFQAEVRGGVEVGTVCLCVKLVETCMTLVTTSVAVVRELEGMFKKHLMCIAYSSVYCILLSSRGRHSHHSSSSLFPCFIIRVTSEILFEKASTAKKKNAKII